MDGWNGLSGCGKWMWIEWMWMWKVESGAVPDLTIALGLGLGQPKDTVRDKVGLGHGLWLG